MATYITLINFTDQGIRNVKDTTRRSEAVAQLGRKFGVETKALFWTLGQYDLVGLFEAGDDQSVTAFGLAVGTLGNVRTETMRAFTKDEMNTILGKLG